MTKLSPLFAPELAALDGIEHAFFTRPGGVSGGIYAGLNAGLGSDDKREDVLANRKLMVDFFSATQQTDITSPYQIHSAEAVVTAVNWGDERPKADGVVTATPGLPIGIVTADCGPVLFADEKAGVVGAAHAGWKGALYGVLEATLSAMEDQGAQLSKITAILGPSISQENYEVGPDFPSPFLQQSEANSRFFVPSKKPDHHMFDLTGYIVDRLLQTGVKANSVNRCTYAEEDNYFSYRRTTHRNEPDYGRQMSAIMISPKVSE